MHRERAVGRGGGRGGISRSSTSSEARIFESRLASAFFPGSRENHDLARRRSTFLSPSRSGMSSANVDQAGHVREPSCSTSNCDVAGGACPRSRFKTVYFVGRAFLSSRGRSRGLHPFATRLGLARFSACVYACACAINRRAFSRARVCVHACACACNGERDTPAHTLARLFVSRFFSAIRDYVLHSLSSSFS